MKAHPVTLQLKVYDETGRRLVTHEIEVPGTGQSVARWAIENAKDLILSDLERKGREPDQSEH